MAAYAAVISLKLTVNGLLYSPRFSRVFSTWMMLNSAYNEAKSLQKVLERFDESRSRSRSSMERVDALEGQIRDCANKLEDFLEFHELKLEEEEKVRKEITSFGEKAKRMGNEYVEELSRDDGDNDTAVNNKTTSEIDFGVEMVGRSTEFTNFQALLLDKMRPVDLCFFSFLGAKGSGRTMVVNTIYEDLSKCRGEYFDCWAWVEVGPTKLKQVLIGIIAQLVQDDDCIIHRLDELELINYLRKALENQRYMIVLDDVDNAELVDFLKINLPEAGNGSLVLFTTTVKEVAQMAYTLYPFKMPDRFFEESMWLALSSTTFGPEPIPPEMEEAGKIIVQNCRCLIIAFVKTMIFLSKTDRTVEKWRKIAADEENQIFTVGDEISEISRINAELQSWDIHDDIRKRTIVEMASLLLGFSGDIEEIKTRMHPTRLFSKMQIISILGMAGIGKTTFVRNLFQDASILNHFEHHVWITLGPKYQMEEILIDILSQIYPTIDKVRMKGDEILTKELCVKVSCNKCLIVLDDLCSRDLLLHLKTLLPNIKGTILVTTRLAKVSNFEIDDHEFEMRLLDKKDSWHLLREKVFAGESCPQELEKAGRMISEKCDGLPLLILTVANELLKVEMSLENWNNVASGKEKSIFKNAHRQISEMLLPSFQGLPQYLKPSFLYMGVFREKYEIPTSNFTNLWISEGCLEPNSKLMGGDIVAECLSELVDRSLLIVERKVFGSEIKTCRLHSVFWHLCNSQAVKSKFFYPMNNYGDCTIESMESQRKLCIRNYILLAMKHVQNLMTSNTNAHSLLCVGPFHQFPVPLNFDMRLLRVMNAITIRLFEFPAEVVRLLHLRYLGLTCNGKLPTSISSLWKLQYLIVKRYMNISSSHHPQPLPVEIWEMKELKHLEIMGGLLPDHKSGPGLLNLSTLLDVSPESCSEEVLKWIPNLRRLGIRIELRPDDEGMSFRYLNDIHHLGGLESLKCVVVNPRIRSEVFAPPPPISMFPPSLKRLSLSGLGYPWEYMPIIGRLENLQVLKLKHFAFQGLKWEMDHTCPFRKLKFLLVDDTNLIQWKVKSVTEMVLDRLSIKHCYRLHELPASAPIGPYTDIEIVDCNPLIVEWAESMAEQHCYNEPEVSLSWIANTNQN